MSFGIFIGWMILLLLYLRHVMVLKVIVRNYGSVNGLKKVFHMAAYFLGKPSTKNKIKLQKH